MRTVPLKRLVDTERQITYGIVQAGPDIEGGVPYVRPVDMVEDGPIPRESLRTTSEEIAHAYRRSSLRPGDLIVSIGPSYGKVCVATAALAGANLTQGTARVAVRPGIEPRFVYWALRSSGAKSFWEAEAQGATLQSVNLLELAATPIPNLTFSEQKRIAEYLDRETARIDRLLAEKAKVLELLAEKRDAFVEAAIHSKKVPQVRLKTVIKETSRACHVEPTGVYREIGVRSWGKGIFHKEPTSGVYLEDKAVFWVQPGCLVFNIVFAWEGAVAVTSPDDAGFIASHRFPMFKPINDEADVAFLNLFFATRHGRALLSFNSPGAAGRNRTLSLPRLLSERIPLPSLAEQQEVVRRVRAELTTLDEHAALVTKSIDLLQEKRLATISRAVNGEHHLPSKKMVLA